MAGSADGNGNGNGSAAKAELHITMDLLTHTIRCDATVPNLDCALSMLAAATRAYEVQLKQAQAMNFAAELKRAQDAENVRLMLARR